MHIPLAHLRPGDHIHVGGEIDEVRVSLRIFGEDLVPEEVTQYLGIEPTNAYRKGDRFGSRGGVRRSGLWSYSLGRSPEWTLSDAIDAVLDRVPSDPTVWRMLASRFELDLFCGLFLENWNRGLAIAPATLLRMGERNLTLNLDIYSDVDPFEAVHQV